MRKINRKYAKVLPYWGLKKKAGGKQLIFFNKFSIKIPPVYLQTDFFW